MKTLTLVVSAALCIAHDSHAQQPLHLQPHIDLVIDSSKGVDELIIGRNRSMTFDRNGRIFVADAMDSDIRVYTAAGQLAFRIGSGTGKDVLFSPCCLAIRGDTLWARERGKDRYTAFVVGDDGARVLRQIPSSRNGWQQHPVHFDSAGLLVDLSDTLSSGQGRFQRRFLDASGKVKRMDYVPNAPADSVPTMRVTTARGFSSTGLPGGARALRAFGGEGNAAYAISSNYAIRWVNANGELVAMVKRDLPPMEYSFPERAALQEIIENFVATTGGSFVTVPVAPDQKPPLLDLQFDLDGRLWVFRNGPRGGAGEADVYDRNGTLWATVQWPPTLVMSGATVSGTHGVTVMRDKSGAERVVRFELR